MTDLQKIWNNIPESALSEREIGDTINRKSVSEIDRFRKVLKLEIYALGILLIPLWLLLETEMMILFSAIAVTSYALNLFTLWKLKQIELLQDAKQFLLRCIRALKYFVVAFLGTALVAELLTTFIVKAWKAKDLGWMEWLFSSNGLLVIVLLIVINIILVSYAWVFYIQRIRSLTRLLKEIDREG